MIPKESWELLQQPVTLPEAPPTWSAGYTGVADPMKQPFGVISALKFISSQFALMESNTMAQEQNDQQFFEQDMKYLQIDKAHMERASKEKNDERKRQTQKVASLESSHKTVKEQKEAVDQYLRDLQHACVEGDSTYEERKAARSKEINALKEAQSLLGGAFEEESTNTTGPPTILPSFLQVQG